ncbi:zinc finger BED domain-containing protein 5-like [Styela clava]
MQRIRHSTFNDKLLEVSYLESRRIAMAGEAHTIAEKLIKPSILDAVKILLGESESKKPESIPLSNNTVSRRIDHMGIYIKYEVCSRLQKCDFFCLQIDESTDVAGLAVLLAFVRYAYEGDIQEDLLMCKTLPTYTTGEEIFRTLDSFMSENEITWGKCMDVCTDGAKSMTGSVKGVVTRIKQKNPECSSSHCAIHRYQLVAKGMPSELTRVLDDVVKIVNFIKSRPLKSRLFSIICEDMGSLRCNLLLHTAVRWLSRGKVLVRVFELREELLAFFKKDKFSLSCCNMAAVPCLYGRYILQVE